MQLQSGKNRTRVRTASHHKETEVTLLNRLPGILKALVFFAIVAGLFNAYIYLNQQRSNTAKSIARLRKDLIRIENETINERNQGERLRDWSYIQAQIKRYQLPLEQPSIGQRRQMALLTSQQASGMDYRVASGAPALSGGMAMATAAKPKADVTSAIPAQKPVIPVASPAKPAAATAAPGFVRGGVYVPPAAPARTQVRKNAGTPVRGYVYQGR